MKNVKKIIIAIVVLIFIIILITQCKPLDISTEAYQLGNAALEAEDNYLDNKMSLDKARETIQNINDELDVLYDSDKSKSTFSIQAAVLGFQIALRWTPFEKDKLIDSRNELAEKLNRPKITQED
ncbi:MAG: hypothetical protein R2876_00975 [Eubacteriales bacterium]